MRVIDPGLRALLAWAVAVWPAAALLVVQAPRADAQTVSGRQHASPRGGELYQRWCAVCHASDGSGTGAGPPVDDASIAAVDVTMRTGAMPLSDPERGVRQRELSDGERVAVLAHMVDAFGLSGEVAEPGSGDARRGQEVYVTHCGQCHGADGGGGVAGTDATVPRARGVDPIVIAQSVRVGQFQMPSFTGEQISDAELDDLVAFLDDRASSSPLGVADLTRVAAFAWASLLGAVIMIACWWTTRPVRAPDADLAGDGTGDEQ